jgi:hypothetical protein
VRLTAAELAKLLAILEKIDRGLIHPRAPDRIGRFLRQYSGGRAQLDQVLGKRGVERRADAAVSGRALDAIEVHPILRPEVSLLGFPLGEVAETLAISEELGGLTNMAMWLKGPVANAAYNLLRENQSGLRLSGDYRWTPPARLTPGEAHLEPGELPIRWQDARCLKAVAEDLDRPAHALEHVLDYRMGQAGLKYFRCVCTLKRARNWQVLPGLARPRPLEVAEARPEVLSDLNGAELAALLIYREPWSRAWTIVAGAPISAEDAFAHAVTWADFQRELDGCEIDGKLIGGIRESLRASGLRPADPAEANLTRRLLPAARDVLRWLRGLG